MSDSETLQFAVRVIREEFGDRGIPVESILLFGSRARGDFQPDSDWDFLVIVHLDLDFHSKVKIVTAIRRRLAAIHASSDIFVKSSERISKERGNVGVVTYYALKEGVAV